VLFTDLLILEVFYLITTGLFEDDFNSSDFTASNNRIIGQ
jgi:hypothetical protein